MKNLNLMAAVSAAMLGTMAMQPTNSRKYDYSYLPVKGLGSSPEALQQIEEDMLAAAQAKRDRKAAKRLADALKKEAK